MRNSKKIFQQQSAPWEPRVHKFLLVVRAAMSELIARPSQDAPPGCSCGRLTHRRSQDCTRNCVHGLSTFKKLLQGGPR